MSRRCKYFDRGLCHFGNNCRNLHVDGGGHTGSGSGQRSGRCKYFDRGHCYHGDDCRFRHVASGEGAAYHGYDEDEDVDEDVNYASMSAEVEDDLVNQFGATSIGENLPEQLLTLANSVYASLGADRKEYRYRSKLASEIRNLGYEVKEEACLKNAKSYTGKNRYADIYVNYKMDQDSAVV